MGPVLSTQSLSPGAGPVGTRRRLSAGVVRQSGRQGLRSFEWLSWIRHMRGWVALFSTDLALVLLVDLRPVVASTEAASRRAPPVAARDTAGDARRKRPRERVRVSALVHFSGQGTRQTSHEPCGRGAGGRAWAGGGRGQGRREHCGHRKAACSVPVMPFPTNASSFGQLHVGARGNA